VTQAITERNRKGQWAPGTSGNAKGRPPRGTVLTDHLERLLSDIHPAEIKAAAVNGRAPRPTLEVIAERLVAEAMRGERWAIEAIWSRMEGKPTATATITGNVKHEHGLEEESAATASELVSRLKQLRQNHEANALPEGDVVEAEAVEVKE
jgi:hypothetical protein